MIAPIRASRHSSMLAIFLLFFYVARTQATYYIDDRNNSILYSAGNSWAIDNDQGSFNQTLTFSTSQTSWMVIPFIGSGITLYVAHDTDLVNVSVMLDGNQNSVATTTIPPKTTGIETYNVSIYDIQVLSLGLHNVSVHVLSGALWFDFAAVNDTTTKSSSASEPSHSHSHIGPIIGGAVGGLVVLAALVTSLLCIRRRTHKSQTIEQNLELKPVIDSDSVVEDRSSQHLLMPYPYTAESVSIISSAPDLLPTSISTSNPPSHDSASISPEMSTASADTGFSSNPLPPRMAVGGTKRSPNARIPLPSSSGHTPSSSDAFVNTPYEQMRSTANGPDNLSDPPLTDEQVDLVNGLWRANVSAADIARVIERMRSEEARRGQGSESGEIGDMNSSIAPPRYEGRDEHSVLIL